MTQEEIDSLKLQQSNEIDAAIHSLDSGSNESIEKSDGVFSEAASSTEVSSVAGNSILQLDHEINIDITQVTPVQTEFHLMLENRIRDINTPEYQDHVIALIDLVEKTKDMAHSSQDMLFKSMRFVF